MLIQMKAVLLSQMNGSHADFGDFHKISRDAEFRAVFNISCLQAAENGLRRILTEIRKLFTEIREFVTGYRGFVTCFREFVTCFRKLLTEIRKLLTELLKLYTEIRKPSQEFRKLISELFFKIQNFRKPVQKICDNFTESREMTVNFIWFVPGFDDQVKNICILNYEVNLVFHGLCKKDIDNNYNQHRTGPILRKVRTKIPAPKKNPRAPPLLQKSFATKIIM